MLVNIKVTGGWNIESGQNDPKAGGGCNIDSGQNYPKATQGLKEPFSLNSSLKNRKVRQRTLKKMVL